MYLKIFYIFIILLLISGMISSCNNNQEEVFNSTKTTLSQVLSTIPTTQIKTQQNTNFTYQTTTCLTNTLTTTKTTTSLKATTKTVGKTTKKIKGVLPTDAQIEIIEKRYSDTASKISFASKNKEKFIEDIKDAGFYFRDYTSENDEKKGIIDKKFQLITNRYSWFEFSEHYAFYVFYTQVPEVDGEKVLHKHLNTIYVIDSDNRITIYCYFKDTSLYNKIIKK